MNAADLFDVHSPFVPERNPGTRRVKQPVRYEPARRDDVPVLIDERRRLTKMRHAHEIRSTELPVLRWMAVVRARILAITRQTSPPGSGLDRKKPRRPRDSPRYGCRQRVIRSAPQMGSTMCPCP